MANKIKIVLGPYTAPGKVATAVKDANEDTELKTVCCGKPMEGVDDDKQPHPVHAPAKVQQLYRCPVCTREERSYHPYPRGRDLGDNTYKVLSREEVESANATKDEQETLTLIPCPIEQVDKLALPDGKFYYVGPEKGVGLENYGLIRDIVRQAITEGILGVDGVLRRYAFLTVWAARTAPRIVRLHLVDDVFGIQQIAFPEQVQLPPSGTVPGYDERFLPIATSVVDLLKVDFDPTTFADKRKQRVAELLAGATTQTAGTSAAPAAVHGDTEALLEEMKRWVRERAGSVGGAGEDAPKKPARKRAPRKTTEPAAEAPTPRKAPAKRASRKKVSA